MAAATSTPVLSVENLCKQFPGAPSPAVAAINLSLYQGEFVSLLGPSGCGKTTLLRLIAGFEQPTSGTVTIAGTPVTHCPPEQRGVGMVFQDYALFPHLTVSDNVAFGLKSRRSQSQNRIQDVLTLVGLKDLGKRYPHELSGGQQQRVALARALAPQPALILLDEPLSNLDVQVRLYLRQELREILRQAGATAIFVTHDQEEALSISDRLAVMRNGQIEQLGTPEAIYQAPQSQFVAEFVTQANFLPAQRQGTHHWQTELGPIELATSAASSQALSPAPTSATALLMVRQEDFQLQADDNGNGIICDRQFLGREYRYGLVTPSGQRLVTRQPLSVMLPVGARVQLGVTGRSLQIFA